jgi:hypothetical protein
MLARLHLNGWPLKYPYGFRVWREADWKRFIDIAWAQRINIFYLWPCPGPPGAFKQPQRFPQ